MHLGGNRRWVPLISIFSLKTFIPFQPFEIYTEKFPTSKVHTYNNGILRLEDLI